MKYLFLNFSKLFFSYFKETELPVEKFEANWEDEANLIYSDQNITQRNKEVFWRMTQDDRLSYAEMQEIWLKAKADQISEELRQDIIKYIQDNEPEITTVVDYNGFRSMLRYLLKKEIPSYRELKKFLDEEFTLNKFDITNHNSKLHLEVLDSWEVIICVRNQTSYSFYSYSGSNFKRISLNNNLPIVSYSNKDYFLDWYAQENTDDTSKLLNFDEGKKAFIDALKNNNEALLSKIIEYWFKTNDLDAKEIEKIISNWNLDTLIALGFDINSSSMQDLFINKLADLGFDFMVKLIALWFNIPKKIINSPKIQWLFIYLVTTGDTEKISKLKSNWLDVNWDLIVFEIELFYPYMKDAFDFPDYWYDSIWEDSAKKLFEDKIKDFSNNKDLIIYLFKKYKYRINSIWSYENNAFSEALTHYIESWENEVAIFLVNKLWFEFKWSEVVNKYILELLEFEEYEKVDFIIFELWFDLNETEEVWDYFFRQIIDNNKEKVRFFVDKLLFDINDKRIKDYVKEILSDDPDNDFLDFLSFLCNELLFEIDSFDILSIFESLSNDVKTYLINNWIIDMNLFSIGYMFVAEFKKTNWKWVCQLMIEKWFDINSNRYVVDLFVESFFSWKTWIRRDLSSLWFSEHKAFSTTLSLWWYFAHELEKRASELSDADISYLRSNILGYMILRDKRFLEMFLDNLKKWKDDVVRVVIELWLKLENNPYLTEILSWSKYKDDENLLKKLRDLWYVPFSSPVDNTN